MQVLRSTGRPLSLLALAIALAQAYSAQAPPCPLPPICHEGRKAYQPVPLTGLEMQSFRTAALNDLGEVAGTIPGQGGEPWRIFVWKDGAVTTRAFPGFVASAEDMNGTGVVVGVRRPLSGGPNETFLWDSRNDRITFVPTAFEVFPQGVNDDLVIVGADADGTFGFALDFATGNLEVIAFGRVPTTSVGTLGAQAVGRAGEVVGSEVVLVQSQGFFEQLPYRWTKSTGIEQLEVMPNGFGGHAADVAKNGDVAGYVLDEFFIQSPALWTDGGEKLVDLGVPPNFFVAEATALNSLGQVVVVAPNDFCLYTRGFLWQDGNYLDLSCFAPPGLFVTRPVDINEGGEILVELTDDLGVAIVDTVLLRPDTRTVFKRTLPSER